MKPEQIERLKIKYEFLHLTDKELHFIIKKAEKKLQEKINDTNSINKVVAHYIKEYVIGKFKFDSSKSFLLI